MVAVLGCMTRNKSQKKPQIKCSNTPKKLEFIRQKSNLKNVSKDFIIWEKWKSLAAISNVCNEKYSSFGVRNLDCLIVHSKF